MIHSIIYKFKRDHDKEWLFLVFLHKSVVDYFNQIGIDHEDLNVISDIEYAIGILSLKDLPDKTVKQIEAPGPHTQLEAQSYKATSTLTLQKPNGLSSDYEFNYQCVVIPAQDAMTAEIYVGLPGALANVFSELEKEQDETN